MSLPQNVQLEVSGLLFDMDGVLISSMGSVERSWSRYAKMRGLDPTLTIQAAHGRRAIETVRHLCPHLDDKAELRVIEQFEVDDNEGLVVLPGVRDLLRSLPAHTWTIVTSATERLARSRLAHAGITPPEKFITSEMVAEGKPHPEPYRRGAQLLGLDPKNCLVIEDAPAGVGAGKAAGCHVLALVTTHPEASLRAADWRVESLSEVKAKVTGQQVVVSFTPHP